ncbi:MAG: hypothetical protein FJ318_03560 [SAR202 cluster bacterium]|nr:hypothetical protein [SAR202 cluster bacterium]
MAKLGAYSYPDIRFGDAVEIAGRIQSKFTGAVSVKGLAWELGMAEGSGTLFAKVAALRDFGLIEGRGELKTSALAQRILHPATPEEGLQARAEAFQRAELLRLLYHRFGGEIPDDMTLLVTLQEITRTRRDEVVRRAPLIMKHITDVVRVMGRPIVIEQPGDAFPMPPVVKAPQGAASPSAPRSAAAAPAGHDTIHLVAGARQLNLPLSPEYIDVAIGMLMALKSELTGSMFAGPSIRRDHELIEQTDESVLIEDFPAQTQRGS